MGETASRKVSYDMNDSGNRNSFTEECYCEHLFKVILNRADLRDGQMCAIVFLLVRYKPPWQVFIVVCISINRTVISMTAKKIANHFYRLYPASITSRRVFEE